MIIVSSVTNATAPLPFVDRRRRPWQRRAWRLAFGLVLAAWILLLLAWLVLQWGILPRVGDWRPQIENRASATLGIPVSIGAIRVRSGGWMPTLELDDVVLHDRQQREALRLPRVHATLSARSLLGLQLRFEQLLIDGAALEARRDVGGRLFVGGLEIMAGRPEGSSEAADWFFAQREFVIRHGRLRWIDERAPGGAAPLELSEVDLVVRNSLRVHELRLDATPPEAWGERFTLAGRFTQALLADRGDWRHWSGESYVSLPRVRAVVLRDHLELPFEIDGGEGALRAWIDWRDGRASAATADVALGEVRLRFGAALEPIQLASLQGRLRGQRDEDRGSERLRLAAEGLRFDSDAGQWPATQGSLVLRRTPAAATPSAPATAASPAFNGGEFTIDRLDLAALARVASRLPLGDAVRKLLTELAPSGQVGGFSARWDGSLDAPTHYQAKGVVSGLTIAAALSAEPGGIGRPGWRDAAIDFEASDAGGRARLSLDRGALVLPGIFEQAEVAFDSFATQLSWRLAGGTPVAPGSIEVVLADTRFSNADAQGLLGTAVWRSGAGEGFGRGARFPGQLDLAGQLTRGRAVAVARYLPLGLPDTRHYLERAVLDGRVTAATFKVRGDLWDFPFSPGATAHAASGPASRAMSGAMSGAASRAASAPAALPATAPGEFRITAKVEDVTLAYVPGEADAAPAWPPLSRVTGELVFDRSAMEIRNAQGRVWGVELAKVTGGIRDLAHPVLRLDGQARGPLADLLRYVNATPIGGWTGRALANASALGVAELKLGFELPLTDLDQATVQGALVLPGNDVRLGPDLPLLAAAKARVAFTHKGLTVSGGNARLLGGDANFEAATQVDGSLRVTAQGVASAEGLRRAPELGALSRLAASASGQTPYRLVLGSVRGKSELTLTSPLTGLALDLPAPLRKGAEAAWPLRFETRVAADGQRDTLRFELGSVASALYQRDLSREPPQVLRGAIGVLDALPPLPERGVHALLTLPAVDADAWQVVAERLQGGAPIAGESYLPHTVALRAQSLSSGGRRLTQVVAGVSEDAADGSWRGNVDADQLGGYLEYRPPRGPGGAGRVMARLSRLSLPPSDASTVENLLAEVPSSVPALDIAIEDFELRGKKLGRLEIEAVNRVADAPGRAGAPAREWRMNRFALSNADAVMTGSGHWQPGAGNQRMVMDFKLELADSGALLNRLGFPGALRGGKGRVGGQLSWEGSPLAFHVPSLDGRINLALEAGQFLKAGPGAGRLLGVLSLQSLPRRLVLDFRDLFQEGFAFDNVTGDVTIDDGVASTNNLRMRGVQAAVLMEGSADIGRETQQLRVVVVPEINAGTASLAYAAINPAIGLGTFFAQLILRRPLIAASTREFTVQGSWNDPKVERVERKPGEAAPDIDMPLAPAAASAPKAAS